MRHLLLSTAVIVLLSACETGYKEDYNTTHSQPSNRYTENRPLYVETELASEIELFTGGKISDDLDIGSIRISQNEKSVRLVFDSYVWNSSDKSMKAKANHVGRYNFSYDPNKALIVAKINGYRGFSAKIPDFSRQHIVEKIYFGEALKDNMYKFYIKLRHNVPVRVFDLSNPGRIVVDIEL